MRKLKAGEYYIGDCCYVIGDETPAFDWVDDFLEQFWVDSENINLGGHQIVAYNTSHGDGVYPSNVGFEFPVDAGLIGIIPKDVWESCEPPFGCLLVKFDTDFVCDSFGGTLQFGSVLINTDYEEEYENE